MDLQRAGIARAAKGRWCMNRARLPRQQWLGVPIHLIVDSTGLKIPGCGYKSVHGGSLEARNSNAHRREATIGCHILNRMAELGRPKSYAVVS